MKNKVILIFLALTICVKVFSQQQNSFVPYDIIVEKGNYQAISISKEHRNRDSLLLLADELEEHNKDKLQSYVLIFDDKNVAKLFSKVDNLSANEEELYDKHYIATYWKSPSARHDFTIMLDGMEGKHETIKYDSNRKNKNQPKEEIKSESNENTPKENLKNNTSASSFEKKVANIEGYILVIWLIGFIVLLAKWKKFHFNVWFEFFVALIMGGLGVQKFREKKIGLGIIYLITFGGFFVGWFADCIRYFIAAIRKKPILPVTELEKRNTKNENKILSSEVNLPVVKPLGLILKTEEVCHFSENAPRLFGSKKCCSRVTRAWRRI